MTKVNRATALGCKSALGIKMLITAGAVITASSAALAASGEPGLPQLKISTWPSQIFWLLVIFGVGYIFMARVVTPRIGSVLEERRTRLDDDLSRARDASAEAAQTRADYEASLDVARAEAADFARQAAVEASAKAEQAEAKAAKKMATKTAAAETKLATARAEAEGNLMVVAAEAAIDTAAQLAGVKATKAQADKAVKSAAKELTAEEAG
jgi:F-type H+-transporting ATPase subunit b